MKSTATFFHAGCPVCTSAEQQLAMALDPQRYEVERIHLGEQRHRLQDAVNAGVKSVPALVLAGDVFHINFGAAIDTLK